VKTVPHVAFEVNNMQEAIKSKKVIIEPNNPSRGSTGSIHKRQWRAH
ncbi:uncharacterized protein METZ01_LOCUS109161, partial [marine metagenome]